jgi:hypothetical protein
MVTEARTMSAAYVDRVSVRPLHRWPSRIRVFLSVILLVMTALSSSLVIAGVGQQQADADLIRHVLCTWGTDNADDSESSDSSDYSPSPMRMIYQITQTEDLQKNLVSKSEVGAEAESGNDSWPNALTRKDFDAATLSIVNTQNGGGKKYTPYDLFGFSPLKWTGYQGEWNWIKVYYCGANGTGDDDKAPEDPELNLYYPNRNRPLDQYADRYSSSDPRVKLKGSPVIATFNNNFALNIANSIFWVTKSLVAVNNTFISLSFSNVAGAMGLDDVAASIMKNLLNGLFVPLAAFMILLTGGYLAWKAIAKRQFASAMKDLAQVLVCFFLGYLMLAMPTIFANLANTAGSALQYIAMSAMTNTIQGGSSEMCSTDLTSTTVKKDASLDLFKNGKINVDGIQGWADNLTNGTSRTMTCQFWRVFTLIPWALGQYGTNVDNLYASGYAEGSGSEINPKGVQGDWTGLAAVPLGDGQVMHNWAVYQISAQSKDHIPSTIADPKTGKIENKDKVNYTSVDQIQKSGRIIDSTNGDWWRVADVVSGYDTINQSDSKNHSSVTTVNKAVGKAQDSVNSGSQNKDQVGFIIDSYNAAGISIKQSDLNGLPNALTNAGFHKIDAGVNYDTGSGLRPGDVLIGSGRVAIYNGVSSVLSSAGSGGMGAYDQAYRLGTGGSASSVPGSTADDQIAFAGSDELLRYEKMPGAEVTSYWNDWIGGNAWGRIGIAFMSIIALVGLIVPLFLGGALVLLACGSVILMAFAPVVLLMGLWAGPGSQIVSQYLQMLWAIIVKRVSYGLLYVIVLVLTSKVYDSITGMMDYLKSIMLAIFIGYAIYSNRDKLVQMFMRMMHASENSTMSRVGSKMTGMITGTGKFAGAVAGGAALGTVKRKKIYAMESDGKTFKTDKWGNKIVTGKERYGATDRHGNAVHGTFKQIMHGAARGASTGFKTQGKMAMYKTSMGRQINQIGNQAKSIKNRNDVRAKLRAEGFKGDVDQELRERTGQPCIICEKKFFWEELTEYGGYYVCDNCRDENAISSIEDIEAIVGPLQ